MSTPRALDERALYALVSVGSGRIAVRDAVLVLGIPPRRAMYLFRKWAAQGLYDWGVVVDLGWTYGRTEYYPPPLITWDCYRGQHETCTGYACPCCARHHGLPCGAVRGAPPVGARAHWCTRPADHEGAHRDDDHDGEEWKA